MTRSIAALPPLVVLCGPTAAGKTAAAIALGNGDGRFQYRVMAVPDFSPPRTPLAAGDMNGDGRIDLAAPVGPDRVAVLLGNLLGAEQLTPRILTAALIIVGAVVLTSLTPRRPVDGVT